MTSMLDVISEQLQSQLKNHIDCPEIKRVVHSALQSAYKLGYDEGSIDAKVGYKEAESLSHRKETQLPPPEHNSMAGILG